MGTPPPRERDDRLSRFLALVLRHKPDTVGIALDPSGFVEVATLAQAIAARAGWSWVTEESVARLAQRDARRYELTGGRIRARYGHSVPIESPGTLVVPPEWLYHAARAADLEMFRAQGLQPRDRQFVHLSATRQDALAVASRHTEGAVAVTVLARRAGEAGVAFFQAASGIYLTRGIPPEFLHLPNGC